MSTVAIISCPAPFERLEVLKTPTIGNRTTRKPYEDFQSAALKSRIAIIVSVAVQKSASFCREFVVRTSESKRH
jgi:hypothetical protein